MKSLTAAICGAVGGAAAALLVVSVLGEGTPPPSRQPSTATDTKTSYPAARTATPGTSPGPGSVQIDELAAQLRRLEAKIDALSVPRREVAGGAAPVFDAETLVHAMEKVERRKLEALSDDALLREARELRRKGGDLEGAARRLEYLLQRPLSAEHRADALVQLGIVRRQQGGEDALTRSAKALQTVIDERGMHTEQGVIAATQMVWTCSAQDNPARGLAFAEEVVRSTGASPELRLNARWAAAIMAQSLGDRERARADFQDLLRELEGRAEYEQLVADIRQRLQAL